MSRRERAGRSAPKRARPGASVCCRFRLSCARAFAPASRPSAAEIADGFRMTGYFLARDVFAGRGEPMPDCRRAFWRRWRSRARTDAPARRSGVWRHSRAACDRVEPRGGPVAEPSAAGDRGPRAEASFRLSRRLAGKSETRQAPGAPASSSAVRGATFDRPTRSCSGCSRRSPRNWAMRQQVLSVSPAKPRR